MDFKMIIAALRAKWDHFDPKMKYQLLSGLVSYALLKYGGIKLDPVLEGFIALAIGGIVGYRVPNEASELREVNEDTAQIEEGDIPVAVGIDGEDDPLKGIDLKDLAAKRGRSARH
jgi:hypothetical protein